jgi:hypothetical protein
MDKAHLENLKRILGGPISESERQLLEDIKAFIDFSIDNGFSFQTVMGTLAHDANGVLAGDAYFRPKTAGYARINAEMANEMAAIAHDPTMKPGYPEED